MKKILAFFLALYVIALTFHPCVDSDRTCTGSAVIATENPAHDSGPDHKDLCSPFCTCSCCNVPAEITTTVVLPYIPIFHRTITFFFTPQLTTTFLPSVWDPPKTA